MTLLCPVCHGKGVPPPLVQACFDCGGKGRLVRTEIVGAESNARSVSVQVPCRRCNQTGRLTTVFKQDCSKCAGTGQVKLAIVHRRCSACAGLGVIAGPDRYPSGKPKGTMPCPTCHGAKTVAVRDYVPDFD